MGTVIVTAIGSFSAGAVIKSCKEAGLRVVGTDIYPAEYLPESREVDRFVRVPRFDAGAAYVEAIRMLAEEEQAEGLLPLTDAELDVLNGNRAALSPAKLWTSPERAVETARDKKKSTELAEQVFCELDPALRKRVCTIPTKRLVDCPSDMLERGLPLILKPIDGRGSQGLYRINETQELKTVLAALKESGISYLAQPLLKGRVVCVDTVRDRLGGTISIPREEFLRTHNGAGLSVRVFRDEVLERVCGRLSEALGILGTVNYEWIHAEDGRYFFLECNPRFSGGTGFSRTAGFDVVKAHLSVFGAGNFAESRVEPENPVKEMWIAKKYIEVITNRC